MRVCVSDDRNPDARPAVSVVSHLGQRSKNSSSAWEKSQNLKQNLNFLTVLFEKQFWLNFAKDCYFVSFVARVIWLRDVWRFMLRRCCHLVVKVLNRSGWFICLTSLVAFHHMWVANHDLRNHHSIKKKSYNVNIWNGFVFYWYWLIPTINGDDKMRSKWTI